MTKRLRTGANSRTSDITYVRSVVYCEGPESGEDEENHERWHGPVKNRKWHPNVHGWLLLCNVSFTNTSSLQHHSSHMEGLLGTHLSSMFVSFVVVVALITASVSSKFVGIFKLKKCLVPDALRTVGQTDSNGSIRKSASGTCMYSLRNRRRSQVHCRFVVGIRFLLLFSPAIMRANSVRKRKHGRQFSIETTQSY
jgi:hypothetical protein